MTTATQILNQLGGSKFIAMTGATYYANGATLTAKFKGSKAANMVYITLNENDLYDVQFANFKGMNLKKGKEFNNVFADQLTSIFESTTGLFTRF